MVHSAAALIARDGLPATGMRDVADAAHAPRGSIGHHFPGGKDELTADALRWIGGVVQAELDSADPGSPSRGGPRGRRHPSRVVAVLDRFVELWRVGLDETAYSSGCSVAAVVHDSDDRVLLEVAAHVFASWQEPLVRAAVADGIGRRDADALATTVLAALEGAVVICRARRDAEPLEQAASVLRELLLARTPGAGRP